MKKLSVLLVDDEIEFVTTLAERLSLRGITVRTAVSGEEALRMIEAEQPQAVVLDVRMPDISGMVVLQQIKARYPRDPGSSAERPWLHPGRDGRDAPGSCGLSDKTGEHRRACLETDQFVIFPPR